MTIVRNFSNVAPGASSTGVIGAANGGTGLSSVGTSGYVLTSNGTAWTSSAPAGGGAAFPSGTVMLFAQTAAPTGWTKQTNLDNYALRVVSGTASTGGSVAFTTAFASGLSAGATTLSTAQMPSHNHTITSGQGGGCSFVNAWTGADGGYSNVTSNSTGGGGSHTHTIPSFAVQYVDVIRATAN